MNAEIGTEAAQFPEKKYINAIFVAVCVPFSVPSISLDLPRSFIFRSILLLSLAPWHSLYL
jgi:hypothetical protein